MTKNTHFRRVRAMLTAARALLTDADRAAIAANVDTDRDRAIRLILPLLTERFCDELNGLRDQARRSYDPVLTARIGLLDDAISALTLRDVGAVLELLTTEREWLVMLTDPNEPTPASGHMTPLGPDMRSASDILRPLSAELFMRGGAFFMTTQRGFKTVTEEVLVVRTLPFGTWDLDPQPKAEEAAELEVEYAERSLEEVRNRCEAEPGERVSEQLAEERRACGARVFDAHLKRRLVQLGRSDLAWQYECGEIGIHSLDDRPPVEIAEAMVAKIAAPAAG
jgi:hypothetical protein